MTGRGVAHAEAGAPLHPKATFLALLAGLALAGLLAILLPFVGPIVLAGALSIATYPVYRWLGERWPRLSPTLRALMTDLAILLLVLVPVVLVIGTAASQADTFRPVLSRWIEASQAVHKARGSGLGSAQPAWLADRAARGLDQLADWAVLGAAQVLQAAALSLVLCPLITFFLLRDGPAYLEELSRFLPLHDEDKQRLFERTHDATVAVVRGLLLTGLLEAAIATLGYALMGIPAAVLLGVLTGLASVVPVVGTSSVWVPVGLVTALSGHAIAGLLVLAWGTAMVLIIDSFAAPWLVGHRIRVSLLPLLFGILGGAAVFGVKGLLIGPLIVSIAPTVLELARRR
ncbi:MAG TPA: AI-2E family transporter, partial [Vicinamibacteria bacterium]|nr:AI-2E family transporter [Vicinamibacteria bacterium]